MKFKKIIFLPGLFSIEEEKFYKNLKNFYNKNNIDFIFFQYSDEKNTKDFSIKETKEKLKIFLKKINLDEVIFIGHSMAGAILSQLFIELKLKNKLILFDPSVLPIPKNLHDEVFLVKNNKYYIFWGGKDNLKEISKQFYLEYSSEENNYEDFIKENILIFSSHIEEVRSYLENEFQKTYADLNLIEIKEANHFFSKKNNFEEIKKHLIKMF